jgi:hypothetical protein
MDIYELKVGLIIQGPIISFGQGANSIKLGFNSFDTIKTNIEDISMKFHNSVFVVWENDYKDYDLDKLAIKKVIAKPPAKFKDLDNRKKQIIGMKAGLDYLNAENSYDLIVRIRADQEIPILAIDSIFEQFHDPLVLETKIMFSEHMKSEPFYLGDFVIAGSRKNLELFIYSNLKKHSPWVPMIGKSLSIKYLYEVESTIQKQFRIKFAFYFQLMFLYKSDLVNYWAGFKDKYFVFLPREHFLKIKWRGKAMEDIMDWSSFSFGSEAPNLTKQINSFEIFSSELKNYVLKRVNILKDTIRKYFKL